MIDRYVNYGDDEASCCEYCRNRTRCNGDECNPCFDDDIYDL